MSTVLGVEGGGSGKGGYETIDASGPRVSI